MPSTRSVAESLASLSPTKRTEALRGFTEAQAVALLRDWRFWGRPYQHEPAGAWRTWLILAGRGWGKTRTGAETVRAWATSGRYGRIALVARTAADVRDVIVEGESGLLAIHRDDERPVWKASQRRLEWPNGAIATTYSAEEPDQLRGPQSDAAWCDELAAWRYPETWDQLQFGLRLGDAPRVIVTTTPRPTKLVRLLASAPDTHVTRGKTADNRKNLAPGSTVFSDGLACFGAVTLAGCTHQSTVVAGRKPKEVPELQWINTVLGNLKTGLSGSYHGFGFRKYAEQYLGAFAYRFNRRFNLRTLPQRLLVAALQCGPHPQRSIRLVADAHC